MDHDPSLAASRIRRFLEREPTVWLSTVRPDDTPHLVPVWFWWDGESVLIRSKPDAVKVRNLRANPSVMLALGEADDDFDVGLVRGRAMLEPVGAAADHLEPGFLVKYGDRIAGLGLSPAAFAATYSQVIRVELDIYLGWHGRTTPASERLAGAPVRSIDETWPVRIRAGFARLVGEPSLLAEAVSAGA